MKLEDYIISKEIEDDLEVFQFPYLSYEGIEENKGEIPELRIKTKNQIVKLEIYSVSATVTEKQIQDLDKMNINVKDTVKSALESEYIVSLESGILKKIKENSIIDLINTGKINFWNQIFGKWNPPFDLNNGQEILSAILKARNTIASNSRRGPGNFAIVSGKVFYTIKEVNDRNFKNFTEPSLDHRSRIHKVAEYSGIDILLDPNISSNSVEDQIIVGRSTKSDRMGIVNIVSKPSIEELHRLEGSIPKVKIRKWWKGSIFNTPDSNLNYCSIILSSDNKPFWNYLKNKIKNIFK